MTVTRDQIEAAVQRMARMDATHPKWHDARATLMSHIDALIRERDEIHARYVKECGGTWSRLNEINGLRSEIAMARADVVQARTERDTLAAQVDEARMQFRHAAKNSEVLAAQVSALRAAIVKAAGADSGARTGAREVWDTHDAWELGYSAAFMHLHPLLDDTAAAAAAHDAALVRPWRDGVEAVGEKVRPLCNIWNDACEHCRENHFHALGAFDAIRALLSETKGVK